MNEEPDSKLIEAAAFLAQTEIYLKTVDINLEKAPHAACFYAHQAGEMALKGLFVASGLYVGGTHSLNGLIDGLYKHYPELAQLRTQATQLDPFYISTRYIPRIERSYGVPPASRYTAEIAAGAKVASLSIVTKCQQIYGRLVLDFKA